LERPDQLEDVKGKEITFVWDCEDGDYSRETVISYGKKVIWREPCNYDCFARFNWIKEILKKKYGEQLWDIAPTFRTCINFGDLLFRDKELELKYQLPSRSLWRKELIGSPGFARAKPPTPPIVLKAREGIRERGSAYISFIDEPEMPSMFRNPFGNWSEGLPSSYVMESIFVRVTDSTERTALENEARAAATSLRSKPAKQDENS
jgi:hypothetical protein